MGRKDSDDLSAAQIMYPCMQCADIFFLKADICQLGMDQRKVNMLAREYCDMAKIKFKPVILSHHMLMGLKEGACRAVPWLAWLSCGLAPGMKPPTDRSLGLPSDPIDDRPQARRR